ncbi:thioredoxin reductase (NADPH) [Anaerospora hongkongensis]|uniref:Thioredoxin reductase n=2 Tax=Anaerospora hongkongensis TaxID=244830 RepID=A0A4R1PYF3_9FIRM|nr:thioredoxin-disulfide reductase [Anaerospora hongkongensis]TCL36408.1 thioredoxin reductase (NADPH) [Anaerospora hongkongensis]
MQQIYDVLIIGAGPAGLSAGLYAGRSRLTTLLIEKEKDGGQIVITSEVENYPGCIEEESGSSLVARMTRQTENFGVERVRDTIVQVDFSGEVKVLTGKKGEYFGRTVIIATGAYPRPIGCEGERELIGKGVSYCATCDGNFFEDMDIYVVGGGDTAVEEAMYLTKFGRKVTIIHRRDQLRAARSIQEKAHKNPKIHFMWDTVITKLKGDGLLEGMTVKNVRTGEEFEILAPEEDGTFGVFGFIGFLPQSAVFAEAITIYDGYILTNENMETNIPGVFAAGDIRVKQVRQVVTAAADGAIAAMMAEKYLEH